MIDEFDYNQNFKCLDFRKNPELYHIGRGEQGVLLVEPYKSEILPFWRFKTVEAAQKSSETIYKLFLNYLQKQDFVGADMARKFLQMGYTRARRYANHPTGKKFVTNPQQRRPNIEDEKQARLHVLPQAQDWQTSEKAIAAKIFYEKYQKAKENQDYLALKMEFLKKHQRLG